MVHVTEAVETGQMQRGWLRMLRMRWVSVEGGRMRRYGSSGSRVTTGK